MKNNSIGLWYKTSPKGTKYASGKTQIDGKEYKITLFTNTNKKSDKSPDFSLILESKEEKTPQEIFGEIIEHKGTITAEEVDNMPEQTELDMQLPF